MRRYENYKTTQYDWLLKVPGHWKSRSIRSLTELSSVRKGNSSAELLSVYREYGVIPKASRDDNHNVESADLSNYKVVRPGDLVMNKMKMWQGSLGISRYAGIVSPAYIVCHIMDKKVNRSYLHMLLRSTPFKTYYNRMSYGVRVGQWDMRYTDFKNLLLYLPPLEEQDQIVRYLDWKVSEINRLIRICSEQLALLQEARKKVIADTLKSANDTRQIPLKRLLMKNLTGSWGSDNAEDKKQCICLRVADMDFMSGQFVNTKPEQLTHRYYTQKEIDELTLQKGDILVEKSGGGDKTPVGRTVIFDKPYKALFANFLQCLRIDERVIGPKYALLNLHLLHFTGDIRRIIKQTTGIQNLDMNALLSIKLDVPNLNNQKKILSQIDNQLKKIDELTDKKHEKVDLLDELKSRLISDVVTGQIDVRDVKVPDFEYIEEEFDEDLDEDPADSDFENEED